MSRNIRRDKFRLLRRVVQKATERNRVGRMTISHKRPLPSQRCLNCPLVKLRARAVRREAVRRGVVFSVYVSQDPGLPSLGEAAQQSAALAVRRYQVRVATAVNMPRSWFATTSESTSKMQGSGVLRTARRRACRTPSYSATLFVEPSPRWPHAWPSFSPRPWRPRAQYAAPHPVSLNSSRHAPSDR